MKCGQCGYDFDPAETNFECPRCGEKITCSSMDCGECDACVSIVGELRKALGREKS